MCIRDSHSRILQGSIFNGGNSSADQGMIHSENGLSSLSNTNITNCIAKFSSAFWFYSVQSTTKVSFCNFENLEAIYQIITRFSLCNGKIERCNYINNSQRNLDDGLVYIHYHRLDILDSVFKNNRMNNRGSLFYAYDGGKLYIFRCNVDSYSASSLFDGIVDNSSISTVSFSNNLKFDGLILCEGDIIIFYPRIKEKNICSLCSCRYFLFRKYFVSFLLTSKK